MVGKQGLSSISLLLIRVAVGIAPALSDRSLRAAAPPLNPHCLARARQCSGEIDRLDEARLACDS
jgi:hypothetical protein